MALTVPQLKTLFRKTYPVKAGGPTGVARSKGAIECLDKLAEAVFAAGATVVEATLVEAQALLTATPPTVAAGSLYAITGDWNATGTDSTVYVLAVNATAFDLSGTVLQADGTLAAVQVDVAAGTYVVEDYATRTELAAVTGGAPQWVAGAQKQGALVFNAGFVYRVKQDIANGVTAPTATNAFYLKLGDLSSITKLIPASADTTNLLATHNDLGWYSVGNPLAGNWTTDPNFSLSAFSFSTLDGTGNRFFGTLGGDCVITSTLLNSRFYSFLTALVIADGARELDITFCSNLTLGARCTYSAFKNCQYVQVGNDCANLEVINCYGTSGAPFLIPQGTKNKVYRNNKEVTDGTGSGSVSLKPDLSGKEADAAPSVLAVSNALATLDQSKPFGAYRNDGTGYRGYDTLPAALIAGSTIAQATTVATLSTTDGVDLGGHLYLGYGHRLQIPDGNSISISYRTVIRDTIIGAPAGSANTGFLAVVNDGTVATAYTANQIEASNIQLEIRFFPASGTNPNPGITLVNSQANSITNNIPSRPCTVFLVGTSSVANVGAGVTVVTVGGNSGTPATTVVALKATGNGAADVLNASIPDQTYTRLSFFASVVRNTGSGTYDASSGRYTAPAAGVYSVSGLINFYPVNNSTATVFALVIYVNGQQRQQLTIAPAPTNSTYYGASGYGEIELALGDYVELWTWHNGGAGSRYVVSSVRSVFTCRFLSA
jgi:hypothetical protein